MPEKSGFDDTRAFREADADTQAKVLSFLEFMDLAIGASKKRSEGRAEIHKLYLKDHSKLHTGYMGAKGALFKVLGRIAGKVADPDPKVSETMLLIASFLRGMDLCEDAITQGCYGQAAALTRQEMETVARIEEVWKGLKRAGHKPPNVKHVPWSLNTLYSDLSKFTHVNDEAMLGRIYGVEASASISLSFSYDAKLAHYFFGLHLALTIQVAVALSRLIEEAFDDRLAPFESIAFAAAFEYLRHERWLIPASEADKVENIFKPSGEEESSND